MRRAEKKREEQRRKEKIWEGNRRDQKERGKEKMRRQDKRKDRRWREWFRLSNKRERGVNRKR